MTIQEFLSRADQIERDGIAAIESASTADALEAARIAFLGDKSGQVKTLQAALRDIDGADKPGAGKRFNEVRTRLESAHAGRRAIVEKGSAAVDQSLSDPSLPARRRWRGAKHPVTLVIEEIEEVFRELGFTVAQGPEAESEWYNFGA